LVEYVAIFLAIQIEAARMITPIESAWEPDLWRRELRHAIRSARELAQSIGVDPDRALQEPDFPVLVPRGFAARMRYGDPDDPLLKQVLALPDENVAVDGFVKDPLHETVDGISKAPGLLQKYKGRALMIATGGCAVHCRYCFRRNFPYNEHTSAALRPAIDAVAQDASIEEVILSGGDPLLLDDQALASLIAELSEIPHLRRLRIHSRIPVVLPERITQALLDLVMQCRLRVVVVVHANHANELDVSTARALAALHDAGAWLLNQSVLLAGVNASAPIQYALAHKLFEQKVMPYYLHMPDRVAGTHHFYVNDNEAASIYRQMQAELPGYLVAKLVREVPGESAKKLLQD